MGYFCHRHVLSAAVAGDAEYEDFSRRIYFIKRCSAAGRREDSLQESDSYRGIQMLSQRALSCTDR